MKDYLKPIAHNIFYNINEADLKQVHYQLTVH